MEVRMQGCGMYAELLDDSIVKRERMNNLLRRGKAPAQRLGLGSIGQKKTLRTMKLPWSSEHSEESYRLTSGLGNDPTIVRASMLTFGYQGMLVRPEKASRSQGCRLIYIMRTGMSSQQGAMHGHLVFRWELPIGAQESKRVLFHMGSCLPGTPRMSPNPWLR
jgi:hypothetical protein